MRKIISTQDLGWAAQDYINQTRQALDCVLASPDGETIRPILAHPDIEEGRVQRSNARSTLRRISRLLKGWRGDLSEESKAALLAYEQAIKSGCRNLTRTEKRVINDSFSLLFSFGSDHSF